MYYMIPGIFAMLLYESLKKLLSSFKLNKILVGICLITTVLHYIFTYLLVRVLDMEMVGVSIATCLAYILNYLLGYLVHVYHPFVKQTRVPIIWS